MMKKFYISFAAALLAAQVSAVVPASYENYQITGLSPDGRYAVSCLYGTMNVIDLTTGNIETFAEGDMGATSYSEGMGNYVSNTGIVLGSMFDSLNAAYLKGGEWTELPVENPNLSNMANGITPDGLRICGSIGASEISTETSTIMLIPAVWDLKENGEYSGPVILPYPELDFSGRVPQYVTALYISDDGRTIAGQIRDYSGMLPEPIIYTLDDENNWSYSLPARHLINPDHLELPEDPGDGPTGPDIQDFMSEEEREAYQAAIDEFYETWENYPDPLDYMTEEEIDAYNDAYAAYEEAYNEWNEKFEAFYDVLTQILDSSPEYIFNSISLSPDGKRCLTAQQIAIPNDDPLAWRPVYKISPVVFNLENGEVSQYDNSYNVMPTYITSAYTVLGYTDETDPTYNRVAKVWPLGAEAPVTLYSYMQTANANTAAWMNENMTHDIEVINWETETFEMLEDVMITGVPHATPDLSVIATHVENFFEDSDVMTFSYILPASIESGVKVVESAELHLNTLPGSVLLVNGKASSLQVFDLNGRNVFEVANVSGALSTGLGAGVYIVKATDAEGNSIVRKVRF